MKKLLFLLCLHLSYTGFAQDYLSGKLIDSKGGKKDILYDRTQNDITFNIFQTVYKVTDATKRPLYTVTLSHDRGKGIVLVSVKQPTAQPRGSAISYDKTYSGLIISDLSSTDTSFNINLAYDHLLSFTDTSRTYPVLHKFKTADKNYLVLDPLSKLRIRKHNEVVNSLPEEEDELNDLLLALRDSLYKQKAFYHDAIDTLRRNIDKNVAVYMGDRKVEKDKRRYEGERRFGAPHGKGMLAINGNIYDGTFAEAKFVSGRVVLHNDDYEYCGEYKNDTFNGTGWIKYTNGSYLLGVFAKGELIKGIALQKEKNGEIYFGAYNGKRNGFGEFQNANGGKYSGQFVAGRLAKGYAKEVDPFGYYTYSFFDSGIKTPVEPKIAEEFFGLSLSESK